MSDGAATATRAASVVLRIATVPVAQPRQRHAIRGGHVANYTPAKYPVNEFKASVRMTWQQAYGEHEPISGPVRLDVTYVLPRPKKMLWKRKPTPRVPHAKKPDRDNLDKALKDALTGLAWRDDAQVCQGESQKWIAAGDEQPHVTVEIHEM